MGSIYQLKGAKLCWRRYLKSSRKSTGSQVCTGCRWSLSFRKIRRIMLLVLMVKPLLTWVVIFAHGKRSGSIFSANANAKATWFLTLRKVGPKSDLISYAEKSWTIHLVMSLLFLLGMIIFLSYIYHTYSKLLIMFRLLIQFLVLQ